MKKIFLMLLLVFCVVSCDYELKRAEQAYNDKKYIESMEIVLGYFEKNPEKLGKIRPKVRNEISEKFSNIVNYYDNIYLNGNSIEEKLEAAHNLLKINILLGRYEFSEQFTDFRKAYNTEVIYKKYEELVSRQFESDFGRKNFTAAYDILTYCQDEPLDTLMKEIDSSGKNKYEYLELHKKLSQLVADKFIILGKKFEELKWFRNAEKAYHAADRAFSRYEDNYKNSRNKFKQSQDTANKIEAEENYKRGVEKLKNAADETDYRNAASYFANSRKYVSGYKDSVELEKEATHKADLIAANKSYDRGMAYLKNGTSKLNYRNAASEFRNADKYISGFKDSRKLADKYYEMGYIRYSINGNISSINQKIDSRMQGIGKRVSGKADVVISYQTDYDYNISTFPPDITNKRENIETKDADGNTITREYIFEEVKNISIEKIKIRYKITVNGLINYSNNNKIELENKVKTLQYTGNVPSKYKAQKEEILGEKKMYNKAYNSFISKISSEIDDIVYKISRL